MRALAGSWSTRASSKRSRRCSMPILRSTNWSGKSWCCISWPPSNEEPSARSQVCQRSTVAILLAMRGHSSRRTIIGAGSARGGDQADESVHRVLILIVIIRRFIISGLSKLSDILPTGHRAVEESTLAANIKALAAGEDQPGVGAHSSKGKKSVMDCR